MGSNSSKPSPTIIAESSKKKILLIFPLKANTYAWNYTGEKFFPEDERKEIEIKLGDRVNLIVLPDPTLDSIIEICAKECPEMVIFYTHGLLNDIQLAGGSRCSSDKLATVFEAAKRRNCSFSPIILIGACFSSSMAKLINEQLKLPVMGFEGELYPLVLTKFIIHVVLSYIDNTTLQTIFDSGILGIKKESEEFKHYEQHLQARLYKTETNNMGWLGWMSSYLTTYQTTANFDSVIQLGFFRRIMGPYYTLVQNDTTQTVIFIVKIKDELNQLLFIQGKSSSQVFTGQEDHGCYSMYSENNECTYNMHFENRKILSGKKFIIQPKHIQCKTFKLDKIPEFLLNQQEMKKVREKEEGTNKSSDKS